MMKAVRSTRDGGERVIGFTLPGELTGLDYPFSNVHTSTSIAVKTSLVCEIPFRKLEDFHHDMPNLPRQMMQLITDWQLFKQLRSQRASERLAGFLLNVSARFKQHGMSASEFSLNMSRHDIGNYLDLPFETVSNLFSHFKEEGMLTVKHNRIVLTDIDRIKSLITLADFHY
jgi:CRP/FNR family transcriptional regulator